MGTRLHVQFTQQNEFIENDEEDFKPYANIEPKHKSILKNPSRFAKELKEDHLDLDSEESEEVDDFQFFNQTRVASKSMLPKIKKLSQTKKIKEDRDEDSNASQNTQNSGDEEVVINLKRKRSQSK